MENKQLYTLNCEICNKIIYRKDAFDNRCDEHNKEEYKEYSPLTKGELCKLLEVCAKKYRLNCLKSIKQNKHMNDYRNGRISQNAIDAILIDFINYVASMQGLDLGLNTNHLKENKK